MWQIVFMLTFRLLQTKNEFNKSAVRKEFLETFRENAPDLRDHISDGKKHNFFGYNNRVNY